MPQVTRSAVIRPQSELLQGRPRGGVPRPVALRPLPPIAVRLSVPELTRSRPDVDLLVTPAPGCERPPVAPLARHDPRPTKAASFAPIKRRAWPSLREVQRRVVVAQLQHSLQELEVRMAANIDHYALTDRPIPTWLQRGAACQLRQLRDELAAFEPPERAWIAADLKHLYIAIRVACNGLPDRAIVDQEPECASPLSVASELPHHQVPAALSL